jgi:hypothetical protein
MSLQTYRRPPTAWSAAAPAIEQIRESLRCMAQNQGSAIPLVFLRGCSRWWHTQFVLNTQRRFFDGYPQAVPVV